MPCLSWDPYEEVPEEAYSYVLDLPVTSRSTNTTYVNYHCAVCNHDAHDLYTFNVTINCRTQELMKEYSMVEFMRKAQYLPGQRRFRRYIYRNADDERRMIPRETHHCTLEVSEFEYAEQFVESYGGRLCLYPKSTCDKRFVGRRSICYQLESHCDPAWPDLLDVEKCRRYSQVVVSQDHRGYKTYYKNPHCARCNFINVSSTNFHCSKTEDPCNERIRGGKIGTLPPSFSVLMNFKQDSCSAVDELWDPFHLKCKKIFCGQLYKLTNGKCVRNATAYASLENSTLLDNSCPKVMLTGNEYVPLGNGSLLVVNASKKLYKEGEYEMLSGERVYICNEDYLYLAGFTQIQELLTLVTLVISLVALGLHVIIFLLVPRHRNLPGKNLFSLACCLFLAHLIFLTGTRATSNHGFCVFLSAALHFFWLASFSWMNVMSVDVCRTFTNQIHRANSTGRTTYVFYSTYAWTVPTLVVGLALLFDYVDLIPGYQPDYATKFCWINNRYGLALFFLLPQGAIILENTILFFVTACGIYKQVQAAKYANTRSQSIKKGKHVKMQGHKESTQPAQGVRRKKERVRLILYVKLGLIQGLSWITGFIVAFAGVDAYWYPFIILNGLQGAFIFLAFDMKRKVWESVWEAVMGRPWKQRTSSKDTRTTTTGQTSNHNRSSKSYSDSDGENRVSGWVSRESSVGQRTGADIMKQATPKSKLPQTQPRHSRGTDQRQSRDSLPSSFRPGRCGGGGGGGVRNGDLRASVVRGKFDGEAGEEVTKVPEKDVDPPLRTNKPDLQRVMDLLQQLQESRSTVDLPDLVQQLLLRSGGQLEGRRGTAALAKCRSFTEGADPQMQAHQHKALAARLKLLEYSRECPAIHSLISSHGQAQVKAAVPVSEAPAWLGARGQQEASPLLPTQHTPGSHQFKRPNGSLASTPTNSYNNSRCSSKHHLSQLPTEDEKQTSSRHRLRQSEEVLSPVQKMPKSQSFSQISHVAVAAAIMQRAAVERRQHGEDGRRPTLANNTHNKTSESLV